MRIEKKTLNDALRVLGKVVCQTSPVELYQSVRFVGDVDGVMAMATDGVELNVTPHGVTLVSCIQTDYQLTTAATVTGVTPRAVLTLDREIILRMLLQGYTTFKAHSDGLVPVIASGGAGQYIAMPIRTISKNPIPTNKENKEMETENTNVVEPQNAAPVVNPLDELGTAIEDFKLKIKAMFEESTVLSRKVKEVALIQKQKERDFIQARRAIERIRMAI